MTSPYGTFYGGWYFACVREGTIFGLLTGPFATAADAMKTAPQAKAHALKHHVHDTPETEWLPVVAFRSKLFPGPANDAMWALPPLQTDPVDIMKLDTPASYLVVKPAPLPLKNGGW